MDLLTHLFLPVTVAYAVRPDLFPSPVYFSVALFAVLPDLNKLIGPTGALHSVITVGMVSGILIIVERWIRNEIRYAVLATALLLSHLCLDVLDGGPVMLLYPFSTNGIGILYPLEIAFGDAPWDVHLRNPLPRFRVAEPQSSRTTFPLINGYGVVSVLTFFTVYLGRALYSQPQDKVDTE